MNVIVASFNPVKLAAVRAAFSAHFPGQSLRLDSVTVESGVAAQPMSDAETRIGARNRVLRARALKPGADFWVGLEGGVDTIDGQLMGIAWMAVGAPDGRISEARSPTLPLPPVIRDLVLGGMELGDANDRVFSTENSKQAGGAFGLLTEGRQTRESVYAQTVELALMPLVHPLWRQPTG
jgi:inosine/xanthosine triphosphatase